MTPEIIIVESMELRGKKKKYESKKNPNFGKGYSLNLAQDNGEQKSIILMQPFM